jgi:hypothetical protein
MESGKTYVFKVFARSNNAALGALSNTINYVVP